MKLTVSEVARSIELYNLGVSLQEEAKEDNFLVEFTREPFMRNREDVGKVVVAFGSYDPLSKGHEALFLKGLQTVQGLDCRRGTESLDELAIVTSTAHFEKKVDLNRNSSIYDRVHALEGFASCVGNVSLAFFNNPLFVNLVPSLEQKYGEEVDIYMVVGADVMEKIVDRPEYEKRGIDMEEVLVKLFNHRFIVSERNVTYKDRPSRLLRRENIIEENPVLEGYADRIIGIDLEGDYDKLQIPIQDVSSSLIRGKRNHGEDVFSLEAVGISDFVDRRGLYIEDSDRYESFVCARQMFADLHKGEPIGRYVGDLMDYLEQLENDPELRRDTIEIYKLVQNLQ